MSRSGLAARLARLAVLIVCWGLAVWFVRGRVAPPMPPVAAARVAIVLDDFGYTAQTLPLLERLRYPVTCAVLPHLPYSAAVAETAHRRGNEVILHLPMEPHQEPGERSQGLERGTIYTWMGAEDVQQRLDAAMASVPHLRGVSNHMGSKATEDPRLMRLILGCLKRRHLYFLDSFVTNESVAVEQAHQLALPCARRDVFLDNDLVEAHIVEQLDHLVAIARQRGTAVGIGHDRPVTLEVLRRMMPRYAKAGVTFVPVSKLVR
jgi:polysaccharide deacetylase 2 family uncharacterized protein YibQ